MYTTVPPEIFEAELEIYADSCDDEYALILMIKPCITGVHPIAFHELFREAPDVVESPNATKSNEDLCGRSIESLYRIGSKFLSSMSPSLAISHLE